ncbi:hypothetical protein ACWC0A_18520 [Streptomyces scopuliridis]
MNWTYFPDGSLTVTTAVVVTAAQEADEAIDEAAEEDEPTPAPARRGRPGGDSGPEDDAKNKERCDSRPKVTGHGPRTATM